MFSLGDSDLLSLRRLSAKAQRQPQTVNPILYDTPPGGQYALYHRTERRERAALATSWVYSAIRKIAIATFPAEVQIKRRQGEDSVDVPNHPLELLFQNPNADMSREYMWMFTHFSMQLSGKAFWFLYPDSRGNIAELWPMPHHLVRPVPDESANPERLFSHFVYTTSGGGREIPVPTDNVVYLRFPHPFDPYGALAPLAAGSLAALLDRNQARWNNTTFDAHKGLPTNIISIEKDTEEGEFRRLKADLKKHHGENMVTRGGAIEVQRLGMTNEEAQYLESRGFNKAEIYEVFGVPTSDRATDTGLKEENRAFINQTIWPLLQFIAGQITTYLVAPFFGENLFAEFTDIRPQDRALAVQESTTYWPSYAMNETRVERDLIELPKIEIEVDGEKISLWDDVPTKVLEKFIDKFLDTGGGETPPQLRPFTGEQPESEPPNAPTMQDAASPAQTQAQEEGELTEPDEAAGADDEDEARAVKALMVWQDWQDVALKRLKAGKTPGTPYLDEAIDEAESYALAAVLGLCKSPREVKAVFADRAEFTPNALKAVLGKRDEIPPARLALEDTFIPAIGEFLAAQSGRITQATSVERAAPTGDFWSKELAALVAMLTPFVERWTEAGIADAVESALGPVGLGLDADVNARAATWAGRHALDLARGLNKTTREIAKAKIKNWLQTGAPLSELEKSLAEAIAPPWRASLIASTEVTRAWATAAEEIAGEYEVILGLVVLTARDERVCVICGPLDGAKKPLGGTLPGGYIGPPFHPRCRCGWGYDV